MVIPTSPRLSKTESGYKSYCISGIGCFLDRKRKEKKEKRGRGCRPSARSGRLRGRGLSVAHPAIVAGPGRPPPPSVAPGPLPPQSGPPGRILPCRPGRLHGRGRWEPPIKLWRLPQPCTGSVTTLKCPIVARGTPHWWRHEGVTVCRLRAIRGSLCDSVSLQTEINFHW